MPPSTSSRQTPPAESSPPMESPNSTPPPPPPPSKDVDQTKDTDPILKDSTLEPPTSSSKPPSKPNSPAPSRQSTINKDSPAPSHQATHDKDGDAPPSVETSSGTEVLSNGPKQNGHDVQSSTEQRRTPPSSSSRSEHPPQWYVSKGARNSSQQRQSSTSSRSQPSQDDPASISRLEQQNTELRAMLASIHKEKTENESQYRQAFEQLKRNAGAMRTELARLSEDRASLRASLQPPEFDGSEKIISRFMSINRAIEDWSTAASEEIIADVVCVADPKKDPTTLDIADLSKFRAAVYQSDVVMPMYKSANGEGRPLEIVIDFALRSIWCHTLIDCIFNRFHPVLGFGRDPERSKRSPIDKNLRELYQNVRLSDPQAVSGRWRSSTFKAIEKSENLVPASTLVTNIARVILDNFRKLLEALHGRPCTGPVFTERTILEAVEIVKMAYDWNHDTKSKDVLSEYHVMGARNGSNFRPSTMDFLQIPTASVEQEKDLLILCGVTMGLETSEAIGGGKTPVFVRHEKSKVITHHFFDEE